MDTAPGAFLRSVSPPEGGNQDSGRPGFLLARRAKKVFVAATVVSLLVHLALMASAGRWWTLPRDEVPFPLEARLAPEPLPAVPQADEPPRPAQAPAKTAQAAPEPPPQAEPVRQAESPTSSPAPAGPEQAVPVMLADPPMPVPVAEPALPLQEAVQEAPAAPRKSLRSLPEKLVLVYKVLAGEGGFNLGQATYTWSARGDHYSLVSVGEATGLAAMFMSGSIIQTSEGRIGPNGLLPYQFWMSRNARRQESARFDWERMQLLLPKGGEPLRQNTQDLLSFPFHLAMTVAEGDEGWILPVTNGRKLRGYRFVVLGRERLETGEGSLETLHVQGSRAGDGSLDVWLAPGRHWLPVRIRTQDLKGKVIELTLADLSG
jgi:hypothetical protein